MNMQTWFAVMDEPYPADPLGRLTRVRQKIQEGIREHRERNRLTNEESKKLADSVDWAAEFTWLVSTTCHCNCGFDYRSHAKLLLGRQAMCSVSKDACPRCGSHANMRGHSSDPETMTIRG